MTSFLQLRRLAALALVTASASCARSDASTVKTPAVSAAAVVPAKAAANGPGTGLTDSVSARADRGRIRGSESAPIWLVEISDFQCPYCKRWHDETFAMLDKEYVQTGKVRLAYLNFPIPSLHPNARIAAEAAMCASVQGKFWEMHDALFDTQQEWAKLPNAESYLQALTVKAGVEPNEWRHCMSDHAALPLIDADQSRSKSAGVQSTPTFLIGPDGRIEGALPVDSFRVIINKALAKASGGK
jgi:protein-disulfide isomerase